MARQRAVIAASGDLAEDPVRLYLQEIGRYRLLTKEDEASLGRQIEAGREARRQLADAASLKPEQRAELEDLVRDGEVATQEFANANLRLVVHVARWYQGSGLPLLDLIQEGNLGLLHAVEKFDWRRGFKFSTYATWWIRQAIHRGIANTSRTIRLPVYAHDRVSRVLRAETRFEGEFGREPTDAELAAEAGISERELVEARQVAARPRSLSEMVAGSDRELGQAVADSSAADPEACAISKELPGEIDRLLCLLDDQERAAIRLRFGLGGSDVAPGEAARQLGVSRDVARHIENRALAKLRHPSVGDLARDLLAG